MVVLSIVKSAEMNAYESQYGLYDTLDDMPDPDILLDDELSDVDFFEFKDKQ